MLALTSLCIYAQNPDYTKLDCLLNSLEAHGRFMGSLALSQNGKLLYTKAIGYAAIAPEKSRRWPPSTASVPLPKCLTPCLSLRLLKLKLEQTIEPYFPEISLFYKVSK